MATLLPNGKQQFFDSNGNPLAMGTVGFYVPNTLSAKDTWQDSGATILNTNPIQLDAAGEAIIYGSGVYRQVVKDIYGNLIWDELTADTASGGVAWGGISTGTANVQVIAPAGFSSQDGQQVAFIAGLSNTSQTTVNGIPVLFDSGSGPVPLSGGEIVAGNAVMLLYDSPRGAFHFINPPDDSDIQSTGDVTIYVNPTGNDTTGNGTIVAPFATPQRAWDSMPTILNDHYVIYIADGTYNTSSRPAASLQRPAILFCDQKVIGQRTNIRGGVMEGGVTIRGQSNTASIIENGGSYPYGAYVTANVGSVGFENIKFSSTAGGEACITSHRGCYVQTNNIVVNGNGVGNLGVVGEAGGKCENINIAISGCVIGGLAYDQSFVQVALASSVSGTTYSLDANGGFVSIFGAVTVTSKVFASPGSHLQITGSGANRPQINAPVEARDCSFDGNIADFSGVFSLIGASCDFSDMAWSTQITQTGGFVRMNNCKSYIAPATQSLAGTPWAIISGGTFAMDALSQIIDSAGLNVSPNFVPQAVVLTGNNQPIPMTIDSKVTSMFLSGGAADRTGCYLGSLNSRFASVQPSNGAVNHIAGNAGFAVEIVNRASPGGGVYPGGRVNIGTAVGTSAGVTVAYVQSTGVWREVARGSTY